MPETNKNKFPPYYLSTFLCSLIGGYVLHLFVFTNLIPNSDGISRVFDTQEMLVSGRWFLHYASMPNGFLQMPNFIGLLSLVFISLSAVIVVDLLQIQQKYLAWIIALAFCSFPSLSFTFLYIFTASAYSIGIFLAIFSVWLWEREKFCKLLAVFSLALSMGIYQAYAPFAIGFSVILVIKKTLHPDETLKSVLKYGVFQLIFLAASALMYYLILHVLLAITKLELLPYLGMEQAVYPFSSLPSLVLSCYKQVVIFFFLPHLSSGTTTLPLLLFNVFFIVLGIFSLFFILYPLIKSEKWRIVTILSLCLIMPLAMGFVQIISPWSSPTPLMQYPYILTYILTIFFIAQGVFSIKKQLLNCVYIFFSLIFLCNAWSANRLYTASAQAHRATESYVNRILTQVESLEGYRWDMPLLIIGAFPEDRFYNQIDAYIEISHYSVPTNSVLPLNKHIYYYLNHWLNIPVDEPSEATMITMSESLVFQEMPRFPDYGSVQIIEGQVVVKVGETYLPKSDYEIAYEETRK